MTKSDLEKWRFRTPFFIVSTAVIPIVIVLFGNPDAETRIIQFLVLPVSWLFAFFYSAMKLRDKKWHRELDQHVGAQIRAELLPLIPDSLGVTEEEKERLKKWEIFKKLTGVFWEAIDSDDELVRQKEHFYANGVYYTAAIDLYIISPGMSLIYFCVWLLTGDALLVIGGFLCLLVAPLSRIVLLPRIRQHHLDLSNEQLDQVKRKKRDFISDRFRSIVIEWRAEKAAEPPRHRGT